MGLIELFLIALGLSADAFAVALGKGLAMKERRLKPGLVIALFFGVFQAIMPVFGWLLSRNFQTYITQVDHWIAFFLLGFIGIKMIIDAIRKTDKEEPDFHLNYKELLLLAFATSIDALAVGITFAFLQVQIVPSALLIGLVTFALSYCGVVIGNRFGVRFRKKAEIAGGVVLLLIGIKILLEHLGILSF